MKSSAIALVAIFGFIATHTYAAGADVETALKEAEVAIEKADSVGFAWRDSAGILKEAKRAAADGERDRALELAAQAKFEGEAAYIQYEANKNAGPNL